jgi:1,4-alpha-glucan branching enzyme
LKEKESEKNLAGGAFTFVLHSHLPYVLFHGRWPHGTDWLFEASAETYVPLLNVFNRLVSEGIMPKATVGITPILAEQLASPIFKDSFASYLKEKIATSENDVKDFTRRGEKNLGRTAEGWRVFYTEILESFEDRYKGDIVGEFARLQNEGAVEIITCAATHGYLPLIGYDRAVRAQVRLGVKNYEKHFGRPPKGIWLPECAYRPSYFWEFPVEDAGDGYKRAGLEEILSDEGIDYFIIDSHLLEGGKAIGAYLDRFGGLREMWERFATEYKETDVDEHRAPYQPYVVISPGGDAREKGASVFTRDPKTALVVWSGEHGYPGDGNYLDFHKKHFPGGNRYWKVTGPKVDMGEKEVYNPDIIPERIKENASHFSSLVRGTLSEYRDNSGRPGIITAPYDTELFGHWWFEGPTFIYHVLKELSADPDVELTTLSEYYKERPPEKAVSLPEGSWGEGGFHWIWFNDWTRWTWKHIYEVEGKIIELADNYADTDDPGFARILNQMGRELLLMESSDWQFLISTWAARDYAEMRFSEHYNDYKKLLRIADLIIEGKVPSTGDWELVGDLEKKDTPFPDLDISLWSRKEGKK